VRSVPPVQRVKGALQQLNVLPVYQEQQLEFLEAHLAVIVMLVRTRTSHIQLLARNVNLVDIAIVLD